MGFHVCTFCTPTSRIDQQYSFMSSGDVTLKFTNGHIWQMPDMILHYVADHGWVPPAEFVDDIMNGQFIEQERRQTRRNSGPKSSVPTRVGYLTDEFSSGKVPSGFVYKLEKAMKSIGAERVQTRGVDIFKTDKGGKFSGNERGRR